MSQAVKDALKGGWHPEKNKSQSFSVRRDVKGVNTVAKRLGHGREEIIDTRDHSAAPLSTLKDPASFGPPPKHIAAHGAEAANASAKSGGETGSALGSPASTTRTRSPASSRTDSIPQPPSVPSRQSTGKTSIASTPTSSAPSTTPKLPPRLPARQSTQPVDATSPPPPYTEHAPEEANEQNGYVNQAATSRLGRSGVSVPGLGIGGSSQSPVPTGREPAPSKSQGQMNEFSSRFKKMGRSGSNDAGSPAPSTGTSWAQKQSALKTADSFRRDPSSVSMSDARGAASTANNFRQRHGDQVAAGVNRANDMNQRYAGKAEVEPAKEEEEQEEEEEEQEEEEEEEQQPSQQGRPASNDVATVAAKKKPPPPPPPKKSALSAASTGGGRAQATQADGSPPPIPLSSKPRG